jgi:hypothetical protein
MSEYEGWTLSCDKLLVGAASPPAQVSLNGSGPQAQEPEVMIQAVTVAMCPQGRYIHANEATLAQAPIICGDCGQPFRSRLDA